MKVFDFIPEGTQECNVTAWIHTEGESPAMPNIKAWPSVVICPGGGYGGVSDREAEPVAMSYFAAGYNTFILRYSVGEKAKDFIPLCQLASTVAHLRKFAEELYVKPDNIAVCGFSAGGHLAGSLGTLANTDEFKKIFSGTDDIKPNAMVLIYPVITADEHAHVGSIETVSGSKEGSEKYRWFGLDKHVNKETPPTFLWHTVEDACVPVQNTLKMAAALSEAKILYELHIMPHGWHGMSVCTKTVGFKDDYNARWMNWSIKWLNKLFGFEK